MFRALILLLKTSGTTITLKYSITEYKYVYLSFVFDLEENELM